MEIEAKEIQLEDERKEMEVIKMFRYRNGMHVSFVAPLSP